MAPELSQLMALSACCWNEFEGLEKKTERERSGGNCERATESNSTRQLPSASVRSKWPACDRIFWGSRPVKEEGEREEEGLCGEKVKKRV